MRSQATSGPSTPEAARRMRAWVVRELGHPDTMRFEDLPLAKPPAGLVRIRVAAAGVNFFDVLVIQGNYQVKPELPFIPGGEISGTVLDAPAGSGFSAGDRVMATLSPAGIAGGGYAEIAHVSPKHATRIPDSMPFDDAAALTVNYQTGWFGLHRRGALKTGEFLLVHAGAGGVGSAAIQLGKAAGAVVLATAGSPEKVAICKKLGADFVIDYKTDDFVEVVKDITHGHGADVVYDPVGGDVFDRSTKCIAFEGRLLSIGFASGRIPTLRANHALIKNYSVVGLHWSLYAERRPDLVAQCAGELMSLYEERRIAPYISRRIALDDAPSALEDLAAGRTSGKIVLVTDRVN